MVTRGKYYIRWKKGKYKFSEEQRKRMSDAHKGKILSRETKDKISVGKIGELNPNWKGNKAGYYALHMWVNSRLIKPKLCAICNNKPPYDLANISQEYKRDLSDWRYICRSCHMKEDGRINNLKQFGNL